MAIAMRLLTDLFRRQTDQMALKGIFGQGFCLKVPFSYGFDEFLDDLQVGSGMKGQASCPLEIVPFTRA